MFKTQQITVFMALWAALGGCGGGSPGTPSGPTAEQVCTDAANVVCERVSACVPVPFRIAYADTAACVANTRTGCLAGLSAPRTSQTVAGLSTCVSAFRGISCESLRRGGITAQCPTLAGGLAMGAACFESAQCQSTFCAIADTASCGTCQAVPVVGGPCAPNQVCPAGSVCGTTNTCVALGQSGTACAPPMTLCSSGLNCVSGMCRAAPATAGAACDRATNPCDLLAGFQCTAMGTCAAISFAPLGQACGVVSGALVLCANGACPGLSTPAARGTCLAHAAEGAPCDTVAGPDCQSGTTCVTTTWTMGPGVCRRPGQPVCM